MWVGAGVREQSGHYAPGQGTGGLVFFQDDVHGVPDMDVGSHRTLLTGWGLWFVAVVSTVNVIAYCALLGIVQNPGADDALCDGFKVLCFIGSLSDMERLAQVKLQG